MPTSSTTSPTGTRRPGPTRPRSRPSAGRPVVDAVALAVVAVDPRSAPADDCRRRSTRWQRTRPASGPRRSRSTRLRARRACEHRHVRLTALHRRRRRSDNGQLPATQDRAVVLGQFPVDPAGRPFEIDDAEVTFHDQKRHDTLVVAEVFSRFAQVLHRGGRVHVLARRPACSTPTGSCATALW